ncbi:MAG TPA: cupredoxin domain-containing protein [Chloroflexota bacterium]|nr:cupredoxin domain-containing protein [Chloroflexota bacterium]
MQRLRVWACRTLGLAALLLLAAGPLAVTAGAQVPPGFGGWPGMGYPGMGSFPGAGMVPDPSYYYGVAGLNGFGGFPPFGMFPGMGSYYGMNAGSPFGGPPGFPGGPGFPAFGGNPNAAASGNANAAANATQNLRLTIADDYFLPAEISVPAGTEVTWLNTGSERHTTTASGLWDSGTIEPGARWSAVYRVPGSYDYACTIHPEMHGRLTVTAS